jgi:hypothetical protein
MSLIVDHFITLRLLRETSWGSWNRYCNPLIRWLPGSRPLLREKSLLVAGTTDDYPLDLTSSYIPLEPSPSTTIVTR